LVEYENDSFFNDPVSDVYPSKLKASLLDLDKNFKITDTELDIRKSAT